MYFLAHGLRRFSAAYILGRFTLGLIIGGLFTLAFAFLVVLFILLYLTMPATSEPSCGSAFLSVSCAAHAQEDEPRRYRHRRHSRHWVGHRRHRDDDPPRVITHIKPPERPAAPAPLPYIFEAPGIMRDEPMTPPPPAAVIVDALAWAPQPANDPGPTLVDLHVIKSDRWDIQARQRPELRRYHPNRMALITLAGFLAFVFAASKALDVLTSRRQLRSAT